MSARYPGWLPGLNSWVWVGDGPQPSPAPPWGPNPRRVVTGSVCAFDDGSEAGPYGAETPVGSP